MRIADVIIKKRNGFELTDEEIRFFIKELVDGRIEGSQLGTYSYIRDRQHVKHRDNPGCLKFIGLDLA